MSVTTFVPALCPQHPYHVYERQCENATQEWCEPVFILQSFSDSFDIGLVLISMSTYEF